MSDEKEEFIEQEINVTIKLAISLLIPESYMPDLALRMSFYKKIANLKSEDEKEILINEINDRFGKVPHEIFNLMEIALIKNRCKNLDIEKIEAINDGLVIGFKNNKFKKPDALLTMIFASKGKIKLHLGQKLFFACEVKLEEQKLRSVFTIIKQLEDLL